MNCLRSILICICYLSEFSPCRALSRLARRLEIKSGSASWGDAKVLSKQKAGRSCKVNSVRALVTEDSEEQKGPGEKKKKTSLKGNNRINVNETFIQE